MSLLQELKTESQIVIRQRKELLEMFGFETRNKYEICNDAGQVIGFCAEQQKGLFGFLMRYFFGHWRSFILHIYDSQRKEVFIVRHPFRFFFQRLEIDSADGIHMGSLQQRFALVRKKFDVEDSRGKTIMRMQSGFFQLWTFPFLKGNSEVAVIRKKWTGLLKESFLDADNFRIEFKGTSLTEQERALILASGIFIDIQYFERKAK